MDLRPLGTELPEGLEDVDVRRILAHRLLAEGDKCPALHVVSAVLAYDDPDKVAAPLERALVRELLCQHRQQDRDRARLFAMLLGKLRKSETPPEGVPVEVWNRYPMVDATTNVFPAPVTITTDMPGRVWIDLEPRDGETLLTPGAHLVVVAIPGRKRVVAFIKVEEKKRQTFHYEPMADSQLNTTLDEWRALGTFPPDMAVAALNTSGPLVVLVGDRARVYRDGKRVAEGKAAEVATLLAPPAPVEAVAPPRPKDQPKRGRSWWIYAAAVGAVVVGAVFVYALDSGEDVQRIEVRWP